VVPALLNDVVFRERVPAPPRRGRIGATGGFVVVGVMDFLNAVERGDQVNVEPVGEPDEDPAVVQMCAAKDLLPIAKNELAMGRAYLLTEQTIKKLPKRNTLNDKNDHKKRYGERRSERLNAMWGKVFGVSKTTLRCYARTLGAPAEVQRLFLAGHIHLDDVLNVVDAGAEVALRVERDLLAGAAVGDVLTCHLGDHESRVNKGTIVGLVKSLGRWSKLFGKSEEPPELTREQDRALQHAEEFLARLRRKASRIEIGPLPRATDFASTVPAPRSCCSSTSAASTATYGATATRGSRHTGTLAGGRSPNQRGSISSATTSPGTPTGMRFAPC
jgi:hypothetical protein